MNNVGDTITFSLNGAPADGGGYTYIFKWWDNTVDTTRLPSVQKKLNVGGTLSMELIQCDEFGQSQTYNSSVIVNSPPVVIGSPSISNNDAAFPFDTLLQASAYDPDHPGGTELSFGWYDGPNLVSSGTTSVVSTGTYLNELGIYALGTNENLTQVILDTQNGVTKVSYFLRGFTPSGLQGSSSSISNSIVSSANNLSEIIIGPGVEATFTAYAQDTAPGQLQFFWSAGTLDGWSTPYQNTDTPGVLANGLFSSQITLSVSSESPGSKTVFCTVTNLATSQSIIFDTTINLAAPGAPTITAISADAPIINGGYAVSQSGFVHFTAQASDPNNALLDYVWNFTQPEITLYGKTVMLRPSDYSIFNESLLESSGTNGPGTPSPILGAVTASNRYGKNATVALQAFITTLVWPYTELSPETSGSGSTTLQKRYWGVTAKSSLIADDLVNLNADFANDRYQSRSVSPLNQYVYLIYPASFGLATINLTLSVPVSTDWPLAVIVYNSVTYNVYRSAIPLTAAMQVTVT